MYILLAALSFVHAVASQQLNAAFLEDIDESTTGSTTTSIEGRTSTAYANLTRVRTQDQLLRWCYVDRPGTNASATALLCDEMSRALKEKHFLNIVCVRGLHVLDCIQQIGANISDATRLTAEEVFIAGKHYGLIPVVHEKWPETGEFADDSVVVIRKDPLARHDPYDDGLTELRGKRLCLSGTASDNVQYQSLVNVLFPLGWMDVYNNDCDDPLTSIAAHFGPSCAPGRWSLDPEKKKKYPSLCEQCKSVCTEQDFYGGVDGALRCLTDGYGDVAVTNTLALRRANLDMNRFQLLCIQGGRKPVNSTCLWVGRRTPAVVLSPRAPRQQRDLWKSSLMRIFTKFQGNDEQSWMKYWHKNISRPATKREPPPEWLWNVLFSRENISSIDDVYYRSTYDRYVGEVFVRSMESPFPYTVCGRPQPLRWCSYMPKQHQKCVQLSMAVELQRFKPQLSCVKGRSSEECRRFLISGHADITLLRADEVVTAGVGRRRDDENEKLIPVASEIYGDRVAGPASTLFLLAVIRRESNLTFDRLAGARSCHPSADDILGWYAPLTILERRARLEIIDCDYARAASAFFWESCVPQISVASGRKGASSFDPHESLCSLCGGREFCDAESPFRNYDGALRCLEKSASSIGGDAIAFVTNDTLLQRRDAAQRFKLLCLDGTTRPVSEYRQCHWLSIPGRLLVVANRGRYARAGARRELTNFLMMLQRLFGASGSSVDVGDDDGSGSSAPFVSMFATADDDASLFGELDVTAIHPIYPEEKLESVVGEDFAAVYRMYHVCNGGSRDLIVAFGFIVFLGLCIARRLSDI